MIGSSRMDLSDAPFSGAVFVSKASDMMALSAVGHADSSAISATGRGGSLPSIWTTHPKTGAR